ncbi:TadE/TadG family type IV pilus assembly protein [Microbacterium sp. A93]|uniref:TadE/TadG family type IV pilus assembly protein n=1 Tax=unclassified Microbacterium TaxID=2609290 RepID=UPI003F42BB15
MRRWNRWVRDDDGSAALEFLTAGVIFLVPLAYLIITLGVIQESTLGAEAAARHTARVIGQSHDPESAARSSAAVLANVIDEYGLDVENTGVSISCIPTGVPCPSSGVTVLVTVDTWVSLPFVPPIFGLDSAARIPLQAEAAQKLSRLWSTG